jgi:hypothetical protein
MSEYATDYQSQEAVPKVGQIVKSLTNNLRCPSAFLILIFLVTGLRRGPGVWALVVSEDAD